MSDHHRIQSALLRQQHERDRLLDLQGHFDTHHFKLPIIGPGRVSGIRLEFDLAFQREPSFTQGVALADGDVVVDEHSGHAEVNSWRRTSTGLYVGAEVTVTINGHPRQRSVMTLLFAGIALSHPFAGSPSTSFTDPI